jgi:hypothetical protein
MPESEHTGLGIASLALGLIAIIFIVQDFLGRGASDSAILILFSEILALIFGAKSYFGRSKDSFGRAGFILGLISTIITVIILALFLTHFD